MKRKNFLTHINCESGNRFLHLIGLGLIFSFLKDGMKSKPGKKSHWLNRKEIQSITSDLTPEKLRMFPWLAHLTDEKATEIIRSLKALSKIAIDLFRNPETAGI